MASGSYTIYNEYIDEELSWFPVTTSTSDIPSGYFDGLASFSDDFSYADDTTATDLINWRRWSTEPSIQGEKLRTYVESGPEFREGATLNFLLIGDFEIQVDYDIISSQNSNGWTCGIGVTVGANDFMMYRGYRDGSNRYTTRETGSPWSAISNTGDTSGKLRIIRTGSDVYGYYDDSGWQLLRGFAIGSGEANIRLETSSFTNLPTATVDYDNFTVTADKIVPTYPERKTYFTDTDGNKLYTEVEYVDFTNEQATFHTAVPTVSAGANTPLTFNWDFAGRDYNVRELPKEDYSDSFTGANGSAPDTAKWENVGGNTTIQSNKLNMPLGVGESNALAQAHWINEDIVGNFDIQVDYDLVTYPNSSYWGSQIVIEDVDGEGCSFVRGWYGKQEYRTWENNAGWQGSVLTTDTSGKLRVTRVGTVWTTYSWNGSSWDTNHTWDPGTAADIDNIYLTNQHGDTNPAIEINWDNFQFNHSQYNPDEVNDTFTGTNGGPPDEMKWTVTDVDNAISIQNNKLVFNPVPTNQVQTIIWSKFSLAGDIDIQLDFDVNTFTLADSNYSYAAHLRAITIDETKDVSVGRFGFDAINGFQSDGSTTGWEQYNDNVISGKLRITRTGSVWKVFVWEGSQWEWDGNTSGRTMSETFTDDVKIRLYVRQYSGHTVDSDFDNFQVNGADSITGWTENTGNFVSQQVWDNNFKIVTHLADTPTGAADDILDSTSNEYHGTSYNMGSGNSGDSALGKYLTFDGTEEFIDFGDAFYSDTITIEAVSNVTSFTGGQPRMVVLKRNEIGTATTNTNKSEWGSQYIDADTVSLQGWDANQDIPVGSSINSATDLTGIEIYQAHGCEAAPGGNPIFSQINDDVNDGVRSTEEVVRDEDAAWQIATRSNNNNSRWFLGDIREVRISNIARSAAWRTATYHSLMGNLFDEPAPSQWDLIIQDMTVATSMSEVEFIVNLIIQNLSVLTSAEAIKIIPYLNINDLDINTAVGRMNFWEALSTINTSMEFRTLLRTILSRTPKHTLEFKTLKRTLKQYDG